MNKSKVHVIAELATALAVFNDLLNRSALNDGTVSKGQLDNAETRVKMLEHELTFFRAPVVQP